MEIQAKIRQQAEQQGQAMRDISEFIKKAQVSDEKASEAARKFDPASVVLPSVRGQENHEQDAEFQKQLAN